VYNCLGKQKSFSLVLVYIIMN